MITMKSLPFTTAQKKQFGNGYNDCSHDLKNFGYDYAEITSDRLEAFGFSKMYVKGYKQRLKEEVVNAI